jgi:hypothetical protein
MLHPLSHSPTPSFDQISCEPPQKLRRMQQLEDIFRDDPNKDFAIQSAYVNTPEHGVVTVVRRKSMNGRDPDTYSIGFNTTNQDWPSLRYNFDHDLLPGPLSLANAAGRCAAIATYTITPSAIELLDAVVTSIRRSPTSLSYHIPSEPNVKYCTFR